LIKIPKGEWRRHFHITSVTMILLVIAPFILPTYYTRLLAVGILFGLAAMGLNILFGYTGLLSFGHAAFWGIGAYTVAVASLKFSLGFPESLILAVAFTATASLIIGYLSLRHTRIYFAMLTLAFAQLLYALALKLRDLTGGDEGLYGIPRPLGSVGDISFFSIHKSLDVPAGAALVLNNKLIDLKVDYRVRVLRKFPLRRLLGWQGRKLAKRFGVKRVGVTQLYLPRVTEADKAVFWSFKVS